MCFLYHESCRDAFWSSILKIWSSISVIFNLASHSVTGCSAPQAASPAAAVHVRGNEMKRSIINLCLVCSSSTYVAPSSQFAAPLAHYRLPALTQSLDGTRGRPLLQCRGKKLSSEAVISLCASSLSTHGSLCYSLTWKFNDADLLLTRGRQTAAEQTGLDHAPCWPPFLLTEAERRDKTSENNQECSFSWGHFTSRPRIVSKFSSRDKLLRTKLLQGIKAKTRYIDEDCSSVVSLRLIWKSTRKSS